MITIAQARNKELVGRSYALLIDSEAKLARYIELAKLELEYSSTRDYSLLLRINKIRKGV